MTLDQSYLPGRGISACWLENSARRYANLFELLGDKEAVSVIGDDARVTKEIPRKPAASLLKQTL
jgi:hypothetical protein